MNIKKVGVRNAYRWPFVSGERQVQLYEDIMDPIAGRFDSV